jgi:hypothetical protein
MSGLSTLEFPGIADVGVCDPPLHPPKATSAGDATINIKRVMSFTFVSSRGHLLNARGE